MNWEYTIPLIAAATVPNALKAGRYNIFVDTADFVAKKKDYLGVVTPMNDGSGGGGFPATYSLNDQQLGDVDLDLSGGWYNQIAIDKVDLNSFILPTGHLDTLYGILLSVTLTTPDVIDFSSFVDTKYFIISAEHTWGVSGFEGLVNIGTISISKVTNTALDLSDIIAGESVVISSCNDLLTIDCSNLETNSLILDKELPALTTLNCTNLKASSFDAEDTPDLLTVTLTGAEVTNYNWHFGASAPPLAAVTFPTTTTEEITCTDAPSLDAVTLTGAGAALDKVNFKSCSLNVASVDGILLFLDTAGLPTGNIDLSGGTNAAPTGGAANANLVSLQGKGWTVAHN